MADNKTPSKRSKFFALRVTEESAKVFDQLYAHVNTNGWSALGVSTGEPLTKTNLAAQAIKLLAAKAKLVVKAPAKK